jgi:hypothetical protein
MASNSGDLVLIVEDEALIAMDLQDIVENAGYQVLGLAASVDTALAIIRTREPARHRNDECFCDNCLARKICVEDGAAVARAAAELSTMHAAQFSRYAGRCTSCGMSAKVTAANRLVWA